MDHWGKLLGIVASVIAVMGFVGGVVWKFAQLHYDVATLMGDRIEQRDRLAFTGAVVAFRGPCPRGWTEWGDGEGRVIVGVGVTRDERGSPREFLLDETHGEFDHELTLAELPEHQHILIANMGVDFAIDSEGGSSPVRAISGLFPSNIIEEQRYRGDTAGIVNRPTEQPIHNNMPPYIALYRCWIPPSEEQ